MRNLPAETLIEVARSYDDPRLLLTIEPVIGPTLRFSDRYIPKAAGPSVSETMNLVINPNFDGGVYPWIDASSGAGSLLSWDGSGYMRLTTPAAAPRVARGYQIGTPVVGETVRVSFDVISLSGTGATATAAIGSTSEGTEYANPGITAGSYAYDIVATSTVLSLEFSLIGSALGVGTLLIDNVRALVTRTHAGGVTIPEYLPFVAAWPTITESINPLDGGGATTTGDGLKLCNTKPVYVLATGERFDNLGDFLQTYPLTNAKVTISRLGPSLSRDGEVILARLYVEDITDLDQPLLGLRLADRTLQMEDGCTLPRITRETFPHAARSVLNGVIPVPFGRLPRIKTKPIVDGAGSTLAAAIDITQTTIALDDTDVSDDFPDSGDGLVETEMITWTGKSGRTLTGVTRGAHSTAAAEHAEGADVFEARSSYVFAVGRGELTVSDIRVSGVSARTSPVASVDSNLVPGTPITIITFPVTDTQSFHVIGAGGTFPLTVATLEVEDPASTGTRTIPPGFAFSAPNHRTVNFTIPFSGGSPGWNVQRRLSGGTWSVIASGAFTDLPYTGSHTADYVSDGDDQIQLNITSGSGYDVFLQFTSYSIVIDSTGTTPSGGSTSEAVLGDVTCQVVGVTDDGYGTITGVGGRLLEAPADVARWIHLNLYGLTAADLGSRWAATRAQHINGHLTWAFLLGFDGPVKYSELRRKIGEQSRSRLVVVEGLIDMVYLADVATPDLTLDYDREVWDGQAAIAAKTNATQRFTRVVATGKRDYLEDRYTYTTSPDDTPDGEGPLETTLVCDFVQDPGVVAAMAAWRLREVKSQLWQTRATAWQNALALQGCDVVAFASHPNLAESLLLRVIGKSYELGGEQPSRIGLIAVEVPA